MLLMAIIIPVALQGASIVSRAAILGQRKASAMRVAERVLNEQLLLLTSQGQVVPSSASGIETDGDTTYPWTMQSEPWPEDSMTQITIRVTFTVRGNNYEMSLSTLFDPTASTPGAAAGGTTNTS